MSVNRWIDKSVVSVQFSCSVVSDSLRPHESQHARPPCPSPTPGVHSNSHMHTYVYIHIYATYIWSFPGGSVKDLTTIQPEFSLSIAKIPGVGNGYLLQYSCLENSKDRGVWRATVHGVTKSWTWLKRLSMHVNIYIHIQPSLKKQNKTWKN